MGLRQKKGLQLQCAGRPKVMDDKKVNNNRFSRLDYLGGTGHRQSGEAKC